MTKLRIATIIPGEHKSPFSEGLFRYLTLFTSGGRPGDFELVVVVAAETVGAFSLWRRSLPLSVRGNVSVLVAPPGLTSIHSMWDPVITDETRNWLANFEQTIDVWFSIRPDYVVLSILSKPVTALFADFIFSDYPTLFGANVPMEAIVNNTKLASKRISKYICFSEYVKHRHILKNFSIDPSRIHVVPHAYFDYCSINASPNRDKRQSAGIIRKYIRNSNGPDTSAAGFQKMVMGDLLQTFPFEDVSYVFLSTQARPHKNSTIVLRAAELLRQQYCDIKYIVTAQINWDSPADPFSRAILDRGLQWDVLSISHVPPEVHAALYQCAAVTVHTSPFEGGLPFTVSESLSMGTPILLADGAVYREFLPRNAWQDFLFNPTSPEELAKKIKHATAERDALHERQHYSISLSKRTLTQNTDDILLLMRDAINSKPPWIREVHASVGVSGSDDVEQQIFGTGWHSAEPWGRWSSSNRAYLNFWCDAASVNIIKISLCLPPIPPNQTFEGSISINEVYSEKIITTESVFNVEISQGILTGINKIVITSNDLYSPYEVYGNENGDSRMLGIGFINIEGREKEIIGYDA